MTNVQQVGALDSALIAAASESSGFDGVSMDRRTLAKDALSEKDREMSQGGKSGAQTVSFYPLAS